MFQLIFMQFNVMRSANLNQGELAKSAITGSGVNYQRYPLMGGGSVLVVEDKSDLKKFIDFGNFSSKKIVAIAVDEDSAN